MCFIIAPLWIKCKDVFPFSSSETRLCCSSALHISCRFSACTNHKIVYSSILKLLGPLLAIHLLGSKAACIYPTVAMSRLGLGGAACRYKMADILTVNRGHFILSQSWARLLFGKCQWSGTLEARCSFFFNKTIFGAFLFEPHQKLLEGN